MLDCMREHLYHVISTHIPVILLTPLVTMISLYNVLRVFCRSSGALMRFSLSERSAFRSQAYAHANDRASREKVATP